MPQRRHLSLKSKLDELAKKEYTVPTNILQAYVMYKATYIFLVIICGAVERLKNNIATLSFNLSDKDTFEIDNSEQFDLGFAMHFKYHVGMPARDIWQVT